VGRSLGKQHPVPPTRSRAREGLTHHLRERRAPHRRSVGATAGTPVVTSSLANRPSRARDSGHREGPRTGPPPFRLSTGAATCSDAGFVARSPRRRAPSLGRRCNREVVADPDEWVSRRGGITPPGARRTGREPLSSSGSHRPTVGARAEPPVGEQAGLASVDVGQEPACFGGVAAQPLVLPAGPTNEVFVDPCE